MCCFQVGRVASSSISWDPILVELCFLGARVAALKFTFALRVKSLAHTSRANVLLLGSGYLVKKLSETNVLLHLHNEYVIGIS